jgi:phosphomannomutase
VRRAAFALGTYLARDSKTDDTSLRVAIASDGRPLAAELVEAAADGLRLSACDVIDLGSTSSAGLVLACAHLAADGGLLVGNAFGRPATVGLKFWGHAVRPLSLGHGLEKVQEIFDDGAGADRPRRPYGALGRFQIDPLYREEFCRNGWFHALRPLRVGFECLCRPLARQLEQLAGKSACRFVAAEHETAPTLDLRISIDGDGEICRVSDERQTPLSGSELLLLLAPQVIAPERGATIVLEADSPLAVERGLVELGCRIVRSRPSRAAMHRAMRRSGAVLGGGDSGRFWHLAAIKNAEAPIADALRTLALLLAALSQSDRRLSEAAAPTILAG